MLQYRSQKFEENSRGARASQGIAPRTFHVKWLKQRNSCYLGETPSRSPSCAQQQSSLSPAFGVTLCKLPAAGQEKGHSLCYTDLSKPKRLIMKCPGLLRTLGIHTELQLKNFGSNPENAVSRRKGHCLMGRSVIRLRGLCNAEVLCDSQAGFSVHPKIVNVNTIVNVNC